jgi:hypothetical protein
MTRTTSSFAFALLFGTSVAFAADAPTADTTLERDIQIAKALTEANRQATVAANVPLTEAQATAFWPIYREYRLEVAKQNDRLTQLIKTFSQQYTTMTDDEAKKLTRSYLDIDEKRLDLKEEYLKKFEKVLPGALVARAMQTEQKLDAMQNFTIARVVPLVPPAGGAAPTNP